MTNGAKGINHKLAFVIFPLKNVHLIFMSHLGVQWKLSLQKVDLFTKRQCGKLKKKKILLFWHHKSNNFLWELSWILLTHNSTSWNWKFLSTFNFLSFLCHCVCYLFRICFQKLYILLSSNFLSFLNWYVDQTIVYIL